MYFRGNSGKTATIQAIYRCFNVEVLFCMSIFMRIDWLLLFLCVVFSWSTVVVKCMMCWYSWWSIWITVQSATYRCYNLSRISDTSQNRAYTSLVLSPSLCGRERLDNMPQDHHIIYNINSLNMQRKAEPMLMWWRLVSILNIYLKPSKSFQ